MPGVNPNIPLQAGQGVQPMMNPLVLAQQVIGLKQGQQNLLNTRATAAANTDMQQAIDPVTGKLDPLKYNRLIAADPNAARATQAASQAGQTNAQTSIANQGQLQNQAFQRFTAVGNSLGSLLQTGKPIGLKDVTNVVSDLVANPAHPMDAKEGAELIGRASTMNPDQLRQAVAARYAFAQQSAASLAPSVQLVNNGQQILPANTNVAAGPVGQMSGNPVQQQISPAQLAGQVPGVNEQGQPVVRSLGQTLQLENGQGNPSSFAGNPNDPATHMAAAGNALIAAGVPPAQVDQILRSAQTPAMQRGPALAPGAPSGGLPTGLAPGVAEAATAAGTQAGAGGAALTNDMASLPQTRAALQQVASEISGANPGPLNDQLTKLGGVLTQLGVNSNQATASQLMHKASMLATLSTVSNNLGVPTDGKMDAVMAATPNATMTPEAAKAATGMLQGLVDYKQAKGEAWQKYQAANGPQSFGAFQVQWNRDVPNAAAFQFNHLPGAEQTKYWSSLDKGAKQQLLESMQSVGIQPIKNGK